MRNCNSLLKENSRSEFYNNLLKKEYEILVKDIEFINNYIYINTTYFIENDYEYEAGIYLTNSSNKNIYIKKLPFILKNNDGVLKKIIVQVDKDIKEYEGIFIEIKIQKDEFNKELSIDNLKIEIDKINKIRTYNSIDINIEGLEKIRELSAYRDIKKFIKRLPQIEEDTIDLQVFESGESDRGFFIIIFIRNASSEDITINSIPFELYTHDDLIIYKNYFKSLDDGINVKAFSGVFKVIFLSKEDVPDILGETLDTIKVKIR